MDLNQPESASQVHDCGQSWSQLPESELFKEENTGRMFICFEDIRMPSSGRKSERK